jgi:peptidoglycan/LPS O-acetylase OafA/YrhL
MRPMSGPPTGENNFDLIRLVAAAQVAFFHIANHLGLPVNTNPFLVFASHLPGVPIFFVVSGFLISLSWERNSVPAEYARNRLLRIYPALWVCLLVSIATAIVFGGVSFARSEAIPWILAQITIGQFYNPDFLRGYGVGVLNGSLWTIPIELQFYLLLPFLYRFLRLRERNEGNVSLLTLTALSIVAQYLFLYLGGTHSDQLSVKLLAVSIAPYLWMFLLGVLLQRNFERLSPFLAGKGGVWLAVFALLVASEDFLGMQVTTNTPHPIPMAALACATIACAYTAPRVSGWLLHGNDVSYGLYVYHIVVLNAFLASGVQGTVLGLVAVLSVSFVAATASWILVERPVLAAKRNPLHGVSGRSTVTGRRSER